MAAVADSWWPPPRRLLAVAAAVTAALPRICCESAGPAPSPLTVKAPLALRPTAAQAKWQERELGALITWGMSNILSNLSAQGCDWGNRSAQGCKTSGPAMCSGCNWDLDALPPVSDFNPVQLNVTAWIEAASSFGAKYLILAANHAGGFALWPTRAVVPRHGRYNYSVAFSRGEWTRGRTSTGIVQEFVAACREAGILPGLYVNIGMNMYLNIGADTNSHSVDPGGRFQACGAYGLGRALKPGQLNLTREEYFAVALEMMSELLTDYGDIAELWFDGGVPLEMTDEIAELIDARQGTAVSFQGPERTGAGFSGNVIRWSGTETGHTPSSNMWSTIPRGANGVQQMAWGAGTQPGTAVGLEFVPAEQDGAIQNHNQGGFWFPGETTKPVGELMKEYEDSVGHNSNYLLELSPDPQGRIPSADLAAYSAFGHALTACYKGSTAARQEIQNRTGLAFELPAATSGPVDRVLIAEDLQRCGQRAVRYTLFALLPGNATWQSVGSDESIGHCRIQRIAAVPPGTRLRLKVTAVATVTDTSPDCNTSAVFLRRMASFDMAGCMTSVNIQPLKSDDHASSGPWTMSGRVPMGFYGYSIADPPCTLLRNDSQKPCAPGQPLGPPIGWGTNEAFWRAYSSAGFNTFVYEYETRDGFASGLDYIHNQLNLPIFPILGLQNNVEFASACDGKMQAPPNRTAGRIQAAALGKRFVGDHRIFGYETLDEPQGEASWATDLYHTLKREDPDHPVLLNLGCDGWAAMNITSPLVQAADIATIDPYVDYTKNASDDWQLNDPYNSNTPRVVARALDYLHAVIEAGSRRTTARADSNNNDTPGQVLAVLASLRSVSSPAPRLYYPR
eukprot:SAG31_NODE_290_length_18324_cov_33.408889_7_plen_850_part_00